MPFVRGDWKRGLMIGAAAFAALSVAACSSGPRTFQTQEEGGGGFRLFGGGKKSDAPRSAISVNGYLWRATLDTLSFMPLASADPYGGVIITDWYVNPEKPDERFKQARDAAGNWVDQPAAGQTEADIENAILSRARQLRLSNIRG